MPRVARCRRRGHGLFQPIDAARLAVIIVGQDAAVAPLDRLTHGAALDAQLMAC